MKLYTRPGKVRRWLLARGWVRPRGVIEAVLHGTGTTTAPWPEDLPQPSPASGGVVHFSDGSWIDAANDAAEFFTPGLAEECARRWEQRPL